MKVYTAKELAELFQVSQPVIYKRGDSHGENQYHN